MKSHHPFSPPSPKQIQEVRETGYFQSGYTQSNHQKRDFHITRIKISYSLIEPQLLPYASACGYKFHALAIYLHPTFTAPPIGGAFGIPSNIYGGALLRK